MALDNGFDATGVEYEKEQCELARESNGVELRNGKIQDVWRELGTFDAICLHHVLEHVESPRLMLKIVDSLLHSGGIALIEVPNQFFNISQEIRYWLGAQFPPPDNALHHLYFFSPRTLRQYADRRRFEIVEMNQFRERRIQLPLWERLPRDLYRWFVERSAIGGGLIIEMYLRKRPDPL
jgi:2-polyprenyl-3-methyl-5-hydroxy-6-metoxy-1,4-benzoquinol methylase